MKKLLFIILTIVFFICIFTSYKNTFQSEKFKGSISPIPCNHGEYSIGFNDQTGIGSTECIPCEPGTYLDKIKGEKCIKCAKNHYQNKSGQKECIPCPEGKYSDIEGAIKCKECKVGTYRSQVEINDTSFGGYCKDCPPGTINPLTGQGKCQKCPIGKYQPDEGKSECIKCRKGQSTGIISTKRANPGDPTISPSYNLGDYIDAEGATSCTDCETGTHNNTIGSTCKKCGGGFFQDEYGKSDCVPCPAGEYEPPSAKDVRHGATSCRTCKPGTFTSTLGNKVCLKCPKGHSQKNDGGKTCIQCGEFSAEYADDEGNVICKSCPGEVGTSNWKPSNHSTRCTLNLLNNTEGNHWITDKTSKGYDSKYEAVELFNETKYNNKTYKPLLMGSKIELKRDTSDINAMVGDKNKVRLNVYEIKILSKEDREIAFDSSCTEPCAPNKKKYPGAEEGKVTMRLYPSYFKTDSIVNPPCVATKSCKKDIKSIDIQKKVVISFDIRKCAGTASHGCNSISEDSKSSMYVSWALGDKAEIEYSSDESQKGKTVLNVSKEWTKFVLSAAEGREMENGIDFVFEEDKAVTYQITNLLVEPYKDLEDENLIKGVAGVYNQTPPGGNEGICPVGPWNLRVADGCCISDSSQVIGNKANADPSVTWDADNAKHSCQVFGWHTQELGSDHPYTCCPHMDYNPPIAHEFVNDNLTFNIADEFCIEVNKLKLNPFGVQPDLIENGKRVLSRDNNFFHKYKNWYVQVILTGDPSKAFASADHADTGKVAYFIFKNLVYNASRPDAKSPVEDIGGPMINVANIGQEDDDGNLIGGPYTCCNATNLKQDAYMWAPEFSRTYEGRYTAKDEISKIYDNDDELLQQEGYLHKCMALDHTDLIRNANLSKELADSRYNELKNVNDIYVNVRNNAINKTKTLANSNIILSNEIKNDITDLEKANTRIQRRKALSSFYDKYSDTLSSGSATNPYTTTATTPSSSGTSPESNISKGFYLKK
jgi:hypothetical protein